MGVIRHRSAYRRALTIIAVLFLANANVLAAITTTSTSTPTVTVTQRTVLIVAGGTSGCNPALGANETSITLTFTGSGTTASLPSCFKLNNPGATQYIKLRHVNTTNLARVSEFRVSSGTGQGTTHIQITNGVVTTPIGPWESVNNNIAFDFSHRETAGAAATVRFELIVATSQTTPLSGVYALYPVTVTLGAT